MLCAPLVTKEIAERPPGFIAPDLSPLGLRLEPTELADGVYALMANQIPKDNNGLIVGDKAAMTDLEEAKRARGESLYGDVDVLDEVTTWRRPEVAVDRFCEIDLGGRVVHLWHFGPGNGSGDTIVHVPDAKVAWTGNFAGPAGGPSPCAWSATRSPMRPPCARCRPSSMWRLLYPAMGSSATPSRASVC